MAIESLGLNNSPNMFPFVPRGSLGREDWFYLPITWPGSVSVHIEVNIEKTSSSPRLQGLLVHVWGNLLAVVVEIMRELTLKT